jgi:hypothetical protein
MRALTGVGLRDDLMGFRVAVALTALCDMASRRSWSSRISEIF